MSAATEVKHTPGPWEWTWEDESMVSLHGADIEVDHVLACTPCEACQKRGGRCLSPNDANARLIAAAPDLLEAAKHAAMEWRLHAQLTDSCRVLEAAIAKAEGSAD